jgi:AraC family transcriptional regulator
LRRAASCGFEHPTPREFTMPESSVYGEAFGQRLHARATSFVSRSLRKTTFAVTELRYDHPRHELSSPPIREDAFLVALHLKDYPTYEYWEDGRPAPVSAIKAGNTIIYDIKRNPVFLLNTPFHSIHYYFPRSALNAIADDAHAPRIDALRYQPAVSRDDHVMRGLTQSLLPAFEHPEQANPLFAEHVMLAVGIHVASTYGGMKAEQVAARGGLAPWQERRAIEMLDANIDGEISPTKLAQECGLSVSHFARAFRKSTGLAPHQWLLRRRVERARHALQETDASLTDVALACGFADQSHFTRVFSKFAGIPPGSWRRQVKA